MGLGEARRSEAADHAPPPFPRGAHINPRSLHALEIRANSWNEPAPTMVWGAPAGAEPEEGASPPAAAPANVWGAPAPPPVEEEKPSGASRRARAPLPCAPSPPAPRSRPPRSDVRAGVFQVKAKIIEADFPSLGVAAAVKETKKEKKKKEVKKMSLADFNAGAGAASSGAYRRPGGMMSSSSARDDATLRLPTAPRERVEGEEPPDFRGGFRGAGGFGDREREREEDLGPSRADAVDSWGAERKFVPGGAGGGGGAGGYAERGGFGDRERGGGFGDRERPAAGGFGERRGFDDDRAPREDLGPSRADEVKDWGAERKFAPSAPAGGAGAFGARRGFEDARPAGAAGYRESAPFVAAREPSRAEAEPRWERRADAAPTGFEERARAEGAPRGRDASRDGSRGSRDGSREPANWRRAEPAGGAAAADGPRGRPKLVLKPRSADAAAAAAPAADAADAPRASVFGAARPREQVLSEQGRDAVSEDAALERRKATSAARRETSEEAALKKKAAEARARAAAEGEEEAKAAAEAEAAELDAALAKLSLELDDKARFARARPAGEGRDAPRGREPRAPSADGGADAAAGDAPAADRSRSRDRKW
jgi:TAG lipase/steryl ester hydrolase/phospholipase A2/LPA acyltransferase